MFKNVEHVLTAAVATSGTFTVGYPSGTVAASFAGFGHKMFIDGLQVHGVSPTLFTLAFGASNITVTYKGATTLPIGCRVNLQLNQHGADKNNQFDPLDPTQIHNCALAPVVRIDLGAPIAADPNGLVEGYTGDAGAITMDGALVSNGVAVLDVPRNIVVDSGGADTAVITITGTDVYGVAMTESITLNGTTAVAGKKAFKTVTGISAGAAVANGAFIGTGDVLGLPVFLPNLANVIKESEDGAAPTAGTVVAGVSSVATATTGDVRGTYDPNSACNGSKAFVLYAALPDPTYKGVAQA